MKSLLTTALCALIVVSTCASVLANGNGLDGKNELMTAGSWMSMDSGSGDVTISLLGADAGRFINSNTQLRVDYIEAHLDYGIYSADARMVAPSLAYHFISPDKPTSLVPYAGAGIAFSDVEMFGRSDSTVQPQYFAGIKLFIGGNSATSDKTIFFEYRRTKIEFDSMSQDLDTVWGGVSVLF